MTRKKKSITPNEGGSREGSILSHISPDGHALHNSFPGFGGGINLPGVGIGGGGNFVFPGTGQTPTISDAAPLFANMRWYLISNFWQILSQLYVELGLVQVLVDLPVDDALRGGVEIKSKQLDPDQVEELQIALERFDDIGAAGQSAKWNRLYGGAGILVLTDQDPETPLEVGKIGPDTPLEFRPADMWELFWDKQNVEGFDPGMQSPEFQFYNYYGVKVHKTRVMRLKGFTAPAFIRPRLRGWGFSVVEPLVRSLNQYLKAIDAGYELLDEAKIDIYKIKNLTSTLMSPTGKVSVYNRIASANAQKNYQNALTMDSEDEWDQKQVNFTGLADMMAQIRIQIASDLRMPLTKIFGMSATGFNSGEDDIENYNAMIESQVRGKLKFDIVRICEIRCQKLFGFVPDDLVIAFKPLRVMSSEQEEGIKEKKFNRLMQAKQLGLITDAEFRDSVNKGNLFDIKLEGETPGFSDEDMAEEDPASDDDSYGANQPDTRRVKAAGKEAI